VTSIGEDGADWEQFTSFACGRAPAQFVGNIQHDAEVCLGVAFLGFKDT
jgi:hypothetical protein